MADDPNIQTDTAPPADASPAWDFGPPKDQPSGVTKADLDRLERMISEGRRQPVDPSTLTNDAEREAAAILEQLDKSPVKGFNAHTDLIVNRVADKVTAAFDQRLTAMQEAQQIETVRVQMAERISVGLDAGAKDYLKSYFDNCDMDSLRKMGSNKATLDILRHTAENVSRGGARAPSSSGGTSGGDGRPPANITNEQEADAQEMFKKLGHIKGMTIEKCRTAVNLEGDSGMADPSNVDSLRMGR